MSATSIMPGMKTWVRSLRPYSFTASTVPITLPAAIVYSAQAYTPDIAIRWIAFPFFAIAGVLLHAGTNVLNDYYDYMHGLDMEEGGEQDHVLPMGIVLPRFMLVSGHIYFGGGILVGLVIGLWRGSPYIVTGILAASLAYFYTNARFSFKYVALGDLVVFLLLGPAMVAMGMWALIGGVLPEGIAASIPVAFFVTAILHGNNLRDIHSDRKYGVDTIAGRLGWRNSKHLLAFLLLAPFAATIMLVATATIHPVILITFVTLAPVIRILKRVYPAQQFAALRELPATCAGVHLLYGSSLILGIVLEALVFV